MKRYCATMYRQMQICLQQCSLTYPCMRQQVENCFMISNRYWNKIRGKLVNYQFTKDEHEIQFFKNIKPKFTSEIEYYCLLYHCILFEPYDSELAIDFWNRERDRLREFENSNGEFLSCFHDENCSLNYLYFLRRYCPAKNSTVLKMYDQAGAVTNGDYLLATFHALRRYQVFTISKLQERE